MDRRSDFWTAAFHWTQTAALLAVLATAAAWPCYAAGVPCKWTPVADASVRTAFPSRLAAAADAALEVRSSARDGTVEAYVKFDLSECVSFVDSAKLRVYARVSEPGTAKLVVRSVPNSGWEEASLSWTSKPDQGVTLGTVEVVGISAAWYELDVTSHVRAEQKAGRPALSFAFVMGGALDNRILIHSREAEDHRPELAVVRPAFQAKISFLPSTSSPPEGYQPDHGFVFGPRENNLRYGWDMDNVPFMRDRAHPTNSKSKPLKGPDRRHEVLAYMEHPPQRNKSAKWEIGVPNGAYRVRILAGDPLSYDCVYAVDVEGTLVVDGLPDKNKRWIEGSKEVVVRDGRLTMSSHRNASKNKINYIEITELPQ